MAAGAPILAPENIVGEVLIVVALLGDEVTVKRLSIRDEQIELRPENRWHRPVTVGPDDAFRILGKVVATKRKPPTRKGIDGT